MAYLTEYIEIFGSSILFRPHLWGEGLYTEMFFFQKILADRYIHRREIRVVSLKKTRSVEFKIKKSFLKNFVFFSRSYRGLKFSEKTGKLT